MRGLYVLDENKNLVQIDDFLEWVERFDQHQRVIEQTEFTDGYVSTVFLGMDVDVRLALYGGEPRPFETMIFGGRHNGYQVRYSSYEEAVAGHKSAVEIAKRK